MIEISERLDRNEIKLLTKNGFKEENSICFFSFKDPNKTLIFTGFIVVFSDIEFSLGVSYNSDIGFEPHLVKVFGDYFDKYISSERGFFAEHLFNGISYNRLIDREDPNAALLRQFRRDPQKASKGLFFATLIEASKEMKNFMTTFVKDGHGFSSSTYQPKFLKGPPKTGKVPRGKALAYSKKLRR